MKNLQSQLAKESKAKATEFKNGLKEIKSNEGLTNFSFYNRFLTPLILKKNLSLTELKKVILDEFINNSEKSLLEKQHKLRAVQIAPELVSVKIVVEWKKSKMWGMNPTAEAWFLYRGENGSETEYIKTRSVSGCGYDKLSTVVAEALNESNAVLKALYTEKNKAKNISLRNDKVFSYGAGYGILPGFEGGVGVSCYPYIFKKIGFEFKTTASGKTFDVFTIEKLKKTKL